MQPHPSTRSSKKLSELTHFEQWMDTTPLLTPETRCPDNPCDAYEKKCTPCTRSDFGRRTSYTLFTVSWRSLSVSPQGDVISTCSTLVTLVAATFVKLQSRNTHEQPRRSDPEPDLC